VTIDGEVKVIRQVVRRMRGAQHADARQLAAWAKSLDDAARGLERGHRFLRAGAEGAASATLAASDPASGVLPPADRPGPAQRQRAARRTSAAAAAAVEPKTGSQRHRLLTAVAQVSRDPALVGLTDVELGAATGIRPNSLRPRRGELVDGGWLEDSGRTRLHHGREHTVWVLSEKARRLMDWRSGGLAPGA
jgi:hypothetical protein